MAAIIEVHAHELPARGTGRPVSLHAKRPRSGRRARLLVPAAALLALVLLPAVLLMPTPGVGSSAGVQASGEFHVVGPGDTLWSIAADWAPEDPVSSTLEALVALNGGRTEVRLGDVVSLPAGPG